VHCIQCSRRRPCNLLYNIVLLQQSEVLPECGAACTSIGGCRCIGEKGDRVRTHTHTHTHVIYTRTVCRYTENIRCEVRCNQLLRRLLNACGRRLQELTQNAKPENDGQKWPVLCDLSALTLFLHSLFSAGGNLSISIRAFLISAPS